MFGEDDAARPVHDWRTLFYVHLDTRSFIKSLWLGWLLVTWLYDPDLHRPIEVRFNCYPWGGD